MMRSDIESAFSMRLWEYNSVRSNPLLKEETALEVKKSSTSVLSAQEMPRILTAVLIIALLLLALSLRLVHINTLGFNSDEAVYAGQGAAIARVPVLTDIFPVFRAHPLLFQFFVALAYQFGAYDWLARLVSVATGLVTLIVVYFTGKQLYGNRAGIFAALIMAVMPYHVIVTRQVLLDGTMTLFATITLLFMVQFGRTERSIWLIVAGAGMGLTFLAKETGILMVSPIYLFLALSPEIKVKIRYIVLSIVVMVMVMSPFPLSVSLSGAKSEKTASNYIIWQLFRRPNHTPEFYLVEVPPAIGLLVIAAAIFGLIYFRKQNGWRERLLLAWIVVPIAFFQLWPTKGFQYLLPVAPAIVMLASRALVKFPRESLRVSRWHIPQYLPGLFMLIIILVTLIIPSWERIQPAKGDQFLAGSGGLPGGREMGQWIQENAPGNALFMTIGPSMANIVKWYGHRQALGLSVSPNPLHRNPSYEPIHNPDFYIRTGELQYIVWDSFSAGRSSFFSEKLLWYAERYHGRIVHTETVEVTTPDGERIEKPIIIIYEVHP